MGNQYSWENLRERTQKELAEPIREHVSKSNSLALQISVSPDSFFLERQKRIVLPDVSVVVGDGAIASLIRAAVRAVKDFEKKEPEQILLLLEKVMKVTEKHHNNAHAFVLLMYSSCVLRLEIDQSVQSLNQVTKLLARSNNTETIIIMMLRHQRVQ